MPFWGGPPKADAPTFVPQGIPWRSIVQLLPKLKGCKRCPDVEMRFKGFNGLKRFKRFRGLDMSAEKRFRGYHGLNGLGPWHPQMESQVGEEAKPEWQMSDADG